jgi:hypothetical protein
VNDPWESSRLEGGSGVAVAHVGGGRGGGGHERGRGWADGVDSRKRVDGADSLKAEPGRQATPCSLNVVVV